MHVPSQVPKKVLLWVIGWLVPDMLKTEMVKLVPPEIGSMLLHTRQTANVNVAVRVAQPGCEVAGRALSCFDGQSYPSLLC